MESEKKSVRHLKKKGQYEVHEPGAKLRIREAKRKERPMCKKKYDSDVF
jgi:hypothetical protein